MTDSVVQNNAETSLFANLPVAELDLLLSHAKTRQYKKNTLIITEGEESHAFYVVKTGCVKIFVSDEEGKELTLNFMREGDYFGELALLDGSPRSTSAITTETTELLVISKEDFEKLLNSHPNFSRHIIRGLAQLLRQLTEKTRDLALHTVYERIAILLQRFATEVEGKNLIQPKITHAEMASMVGCRREMVSRIMSELAKGGYITLEPKAIVLNRKLPAKW